MFISRSDIGNGRVEVTASLSDGCAGTGAFIINFYLKDQFYHESSCLLAVQAGDIPPEYIEGITFNAQCTNVTMTLAVPPTITVEFDVSVNSSKRGYQTCGRFIVGNERKCITTPFPTLTAPCTLLSVIEWHFQRGNIFHAYCKQCCLIVLVSFLLLDRLCN